MKMNFESRHGFFILLSLLFSFFISVTAESLNNDSAIILEDDDNKVGSNINEGDDSKNTSTSNGFLDLTSKERLTLEKFRTLVAPNLTHDYMSSDEYLIRFLRQTHFNLSSSQDLIFNMIKWRKDENIDNLLEEEFPEFEGDYATFLEGCDRMDRPIISVPLGLWDIRQAVLAGQGPKLKRFIDKIFEDGTSFLRSANEIGLQLHEATLICNLDGFDMKTHACPQCIELYLYFFKSISIHYPGFVKQIYFINTPQIATLIFDLYKDIVTPEIRAMTTIFGRDQVELKKDLARVIPKSSLSRNFGGDKESALDFSYIRMGQHLISSLNKVGAVRIKNNCEKDLAMYETLIQEISLVMQKRGRRKAMKEGRDYDPICDNEF